MIFTSTSTQMPAYARPLPGPMTFDFHSGDHSSPAALPGSPYIVAVASSGGRGQASNNFGHEQQLELAPATPLQAGRAADGGGGGRALCAITEGIEARHSAASASHGGLSTGSFIPAAPAFRGYGANRPSSPAGGSSRASFEPPSAWSSSAGSSRPASSRPSSESAVGHSAGGWSGLSGFFRTSHQELGHETPVQAFSARAEQAKQWETGHASAGGAAQAEEAQLVDGHVMACVQASFRATSKEQQHVLHQALQKPQQAPAVKRLPAGCGDWQAECRRLLASGHAYSALTRPGPSSGELLRCYVTRKKPLLGGAQQFHLYLEQADLYLMSALRYTSKAGSARFLLASDPSDMDSSRSACIGKLKSNFSGTSYVLCAKRCATNHNMTKSFQQQSLAASFESTLLTASGGPRSMAVALPAPDAAAAQLAPRKLDLVACLERARTRELDAAAERQLGLLHSSPPVQDAKSGKSTLDFTGRAVKGSVKNVQLVAWDHNARQLGRQVLLQFAKIKKDTYCLDFAYPVSAFQAFAIALASTDAKLCYAL